MEGGVGGEDEEVIHVDDEPSFSNHIAEGVIHETLEGGGQIGKSKEHDGGFKESLVGDEGRLPLVAILDPYIVVSPTDAELGEYFGIAEFVYEVGDKGKGVSVANGVFVDVAVVLAGAESAIFLFDKKEGGGLR